MENEKPLFEEENMKNLQIWAAEQTRINGLPDVEFGLANIPICLVSKMPRFSILDIYGENIKIKERLRNNRITLEEIPNIAADHHFCISFEDMSGRTKRGGYVSGGGGGWASNRQEAINKIREYLSQARYSSGDIYITSEKIKEYTEEELATSRFLNDLEYKLSLLERYQ